LAQPRVDSSQDKPAGRFAHVQLRTSGRTREPHSPGPPSSSYPRGGICFH
jgi:hypothetical protein